MPEVRITVPMGGPLDVDDEFGATLNLSEYLGKLLVVKTVTVDEIILEIVNEPLIPCPTLRKRTKVENP